jgi:hypothetical protein
VLLIVSNKPLNVFETPVRPEQQGSGAVTRSPSALFRYNAQNRAAAQPLPSHPSLQYLPRSEPSWVDFLQNQILHARQRLGWQTEAGGVGPYMADLGLGEVASALPLSYLSFARTPHGLQRNGFPSSKRSRCLKPISLTLTFFLQSLHSPSDGKHDLQRKGRPFSKFSRCVSDKSGARNSLAQTWHVPTCTRPGFTSIDPVLAATPIHFANRRAPRAQGEL